MTAHGSPSQVEGADESGEEDERRQLHAQEIGSEEGLSDGLGRDGGARGLKTRRGRSRPCGTAPEQVASVDRT